MVHTKSDSNQLSPAAITFDIDWAPDWAIEECINICDKYEIPSTFFVTHHSKIIEECAKEENIELGIHPNFFPESSQGNSPSEVLAFCRDLVPNARSMRTHGLMQWTGLYGIVAKEFASIEIDVSLYLCGHRGLHPIPMPVIGGGDIIRLPYFWEDDLNAMFESPDWFCIPASEGLCIFDFHPVHVCLNMSSLEQYKSLKNSLGGKSLSLAEKKDFAPYINHQNQGTKDFLLMALEKFQDRGYASISSLANWYQDL